MPMIARSPRLPRSRPCARRTTPLAPAGVVTALSITLLAGTACSRPTASPVPPGPDAAIGRTLSESDFLEAPVQLTFADRFNRAGEAYFDPSVRWIIFQATPQPEGDAPPSPHYAMYVAKLRFDGAGQITGIEDPIELSAPGTANTCGWFHPTLPGVVLFGSTLAPPADQTSPGYSRDRSRYTWQFPSEMEIVTSTVSAIVDDLVTDPAERSRLRARPDLDRPTVLFSRPGYDAEASWSADGRWVLYANVDPATGDADLWAWIEAQNEHVPLVRQPGYDGGPFISPCGGWICYRSDRRGDNHLQLFAAALDLDSDGLPRGIRAEYQLTDNEHVNWAPFWHPRGDYMVFTSSEVGHHNYEVFAIPFDRAAPEARQPTFRITESPGFDGLPVFSPDGRYLMWTAQRGADRAADGRPSSQMWLARLRHERPAGLRSASERAEQAVGMSLVARDADPVSAALQRGGPIVQRFDQHVTTLANPFLEGRLPGTPGMEIAESYIEWWMRTIGLEPAFAPASAADGGGGFRQAFELRSVSGFRPTGNEAPPVPVTAYNVGGILPGRGALADELIVIGAHHDHLGTGLFGSRTGAGKIHPGADDNASGVAGALVLAELLRDEWNRLGRRDRRSVLILTFSAEESGLNGSAHYVANPARPIDRHVLMINLDMIGRITQQRFRIHGTNSGDGLRALVEPLAARSPLVVEMPAELPGRSDHMSFYRKEIPVLFGIITEFHEDYHMPTDESWRINRFGSARAIELLRDIVVEAALRPDRFAFTPVPGADAAEGGPAMRALRIRFGITPGNYNDPHPGIVAQAVAAGTSAERGGVRPGDRIMRWDGELLDSMTTWMTLMGRHEPGDIVTLEIDRAGETVTLRVVLQGRSPSPQE